MLKQFDGLRERLLCAGIAPRHVRRYLRELNEHLSDLTAEERSAGRNSEEALSSALARLGDIDGLATAMIRRPEFRSWSARAPWAAFCLAPLVFLASAYLFACFYLWCGWNLFLPISDTPFGNHDGSIYGFSNLYFQAGKCFFFVAPLIIGWMVALTAARQRLKGWWPIIAFTLVACMGATAHIQASRSAVQGGLGHIKMSFFGLGTGLQGGINSVYGFVIFAVSLLPYVVWRLRRMTTASS